MSRSVPIPIYIAKGRDFSMTLSFPYSILGMSFYLRIVNKDNETDYFDLSVTTDTDNNKAFFELTSAQSVNLALKTKYVYDIKAVDSFGKSSNLIDESPVTVIKTWTP